MYSEPKTKNSAEQQCTGTQNERSRRRRKIKERGKEQGSSCSSSSRLEDHYIEVISGW